jgi:hypothetical protein
MLELRKVSNFVFALSQLLRMHKKEDAILHYLFVAKAKTKCSKNIESYATLGTCAKSISICTRF